MTSKALQVFSPSFRDVHASGRSRRSALRAAGVRVRSDIVWDKLCSIMLLQRGQRFPGDTDCSCSVWHEPDTSYATCAAILARADPGDGELVPGCERRNGKGNRKKRAWVRVKFTKTKRPRKAAHPCNPQGWATRGRRDFTELGILKR